MSYSVTHGTGAMERGYRDVTLAIELEVWRTGEPDPRAEGLAQLDAYLAGLSLDRGWLVIFDRREPRRPAAERTTTEPATSPAGRGVTVLRA